MDAKPACGRRTTGRYSIFIGLISATALGAGCAQSPGRSLARFWSDLPNVRWSLSEEAAEDEAASDTEIASQSASDSDLSESDSGGNSLTSRFKFSGWTSEGNQSSTRDAQSTAIASHSGLHDPFLADEVGRAHITSNDVSSEDEDVSDAPKISSQRDRLRAALSEDSRRNREPVVDLAEQERFRVRVEALMIRAKRHFEQDDLDAAQRDAELAQLLAEECNLEFAPDDDRPVDLLASIVGRLEALAAATAEANEVGEELTPDSRADVNATHPVDDITEFDPYVSRRLPLHPKKRTSIFDSSLVVLETPSFEDADAEAALPISPTAAIAADHSDAVSLLDQADNQPKDDSAPEQIDQAVKEATSPAEEITEVEEAPAPPTLNGPSFGDIDLPQEDEFAAAPGPRTENAKPLKGGTVTLQDLHADSGDQDEDGKEILSAETVPRWLVLAVLSAVAAVVSIWLIRRRMLASF